jgi:hypothetical protein
LEEIGVPSYPEGHPTIPDRAAARRPPREAALRARDDDPDVVQSGCGGVMDHTATRRGHHAPDPSGRAGCAAVPQADDHGRAHRCGAIR